MNVILSNIGFMLLRTLLRILLSSEVRNVVADAVDYGETRGGGGQKKMTSALSYLREHAPGVVAARTEKELRTLVELKLDDLL